ncbi:SAV_6107 family HEPN domain-containing protein [Parasphingorhabdus pacifica]
MSQSNELSIPVPRRSVDDRPVAVSGGSAASASSRALLVRAGNRLREGERAGPPTERYVAAHLAALRAATAIVVARGPRRVGDRPVSVWRLLGDVAPEFGEWAAFFAAGSERRAIAEAGIPGVSDEQADRVLRRAGEFLDLVDIELSGAAR